MYTYEHQRVVWSKNYGGCLMTQRKRDGSWVDWSSSDEGHYPEHDAFAKRAVRVANACIQIDRLTHRATQLESRAAVVRQRAFNVAKAAGFNAPEQDCARFNP